MLEYGALTKFDDDYITVISDYMLHQDKSRVIDNITKLAELGQFNAIQTYYILDGQKNCKIENHIQKIIQTKPRNFNECITLARYYAYIDRSEIEEVDILINRYHKFKDDLELGGSLGICNSIQDLNEIYNEICTYRFISNLLSAIEILHDAPFQNEKEFELELELMQESKVHKMLKQNVKRREFKRARRDLIWEVKYDPNDVASKYYLAKNIARFGGNKKELLLGKKILEELSIRPLYMDKIKTTDEKQVDNRANNIEKV